MSLEDRDEPLAKTNAINDDDGDDDDDEEPQDEESELFSFVCRRTTRLIFSPPLTFLLC